MIRNRILSGQSKHDTAMHQFDFTKRHAPVHQGWTICRFATLGGGNHFIEVNQDADGIYLVIHSGSRSLGKEVPEYHQEIAYQKLTTKRKELKIELKDQLKKAHTMLIQEIIKSLYNFKDE